MKILLAILLAVLMVVVVTFANAKPMGVVDRGGVKITLYDEDCESKDRVDLPYRATWDEKGKRFEGCFGVHPQAQLIILYFREDKSLALVPMQAIQRVSLM